MWGEIICPYQNFSSTENDFWERMSNFIAHILGMWLFINAKIKVKPS